VTPQARLVQIALSFVGTREEGENGGSLVQAFQKAVDGKASGEPWCLCFVQFCVAQASQETGVHSLVARTEHCLTAWNLTRPELRISRPEPGCIVIWEHLENGKPTGRGHAGIVVAVPTDKTFETVEGNTTPGPGVEREGDGVYHRLRLLNPPGSMRVKGFLQAWPSPTWGPSGSKDAPSGSPSPTASSAT
jgi:hypothetical protein